MESSGLEKQPHPREPKQAVGDPLDRQELDAQSSGLRHKGGEPTLGGWQGGPKECMRPRHEVLGMKGQMASQAATEA